jgi:hypothetical protein
MTNNPIQDLANLETGWDGYWAEPLSDKCIERGVEFWSALL